MFVHICEYNRSYLFCNTNLSSHYAVIPVSGASTVPDSGKDNSYGPVAQTVPALQYLIPFVPAVISVQVGDASVPSLAANVTTGAVPLYIYRT